MHTFAQFELGTDPASISVAHRPSKAVTRTARSKALTSLAELLHPRFDTEGHVHVTVRVCTPGYQRFAVFKFAPHLSSPFTSAGITAKRPVIRNLPFTGPGDARPTAAAIVADEDIAGKLCGKVILITGCSSGIGVESARALHSTGADLYVTARDLSKAQEVIDDILASSNGQGKLQLLELNLDSLDSVRKCASSFLSQCKQLNILINNAGMPVSET